MAKLLYNPETKTTVNPEYTNIKPGTPGWIEVEKMGDTTSVAKPKETQAGALQAMSIAAAQPGATAQNIQQAFAKPTPAVPTAQPMRVYEYVTKTGQLGTVEAASAEEAFKIAKDISPTSGVARKKEEEPFKPMEVSPKFPDVQPDIIEPPKSSAVISPGEGVDLKVEDTTAPHEVIKLAADREISSKAKIDNQQTLADVAIQAQNQKLFEDLEKNKDIIAQFNTPVFKEAIKTLQHEYLLPTLDLAVERLEAKEREGLNRIVGEIKTHTAELATYRQRYADLDAQEFADLTATKGVGTKAHYSRMVTKIKEQYAIERANLNGRVAWLDTVLSGLREEKIDAKTAVSEYIQDVTFAYTLRINGLEKFISLNKGFLDKAEERYRVDLNTLVNNIKEERNKKAETAAANFQLMLKDPHAGITPDDTPEEAYEKFFRSGNYTRTYDLDHKTKVLQYQKALKDLNDETEKFIIKSKGKIYNYSTEEGMKALTEDHTPNELIILMGSAGAGASSLVPTLLNEYRGLIDPRHKGPVSRIYTSLDNVISGEIKTWKKTRDQIVGLSDEEKDEKVKDLIRRIDKQVDDGVFFKDREERDAWNLYKDNNIYIHILEKYFTRVSLPPGATADIGSELTPEGGPGWFGKISNWIGGIGSATTPKETDLTDYQKESVKRQMEEYGKGIEDLIK